MWLFYNKNIVKRDVTLIKKGLHIKKTSSEYIIIKHICGIGKIVMSSQEDFAFRLSLALRHHSLPIISKIFLNSKQLHLNVIFKLFNL